MSGPFRFNQEPVRSPLDRSASPFSGQPVNFKTNVNRAKTKKWVQAKKNAYDGDDWGGYDEYDEYGVNQEPQHHTGGLQPGQRYHAQDQPSRSFTEPAPQAILPKARRNSFEQGEEQRAFSATIPHPQYGAGSSLEDPQRLGDSRAHKEDHEPQPQRQQETGPTATLPPLQTRISQVPNDFNSPSNTQFPPRKSSISQVESPAASPIVSPRSRTGSHSDKPLPFIRPADIYRRVEEERVRERASLDSSRPSLDSLTSRPKEDVSSPTDASKTLHPLETVAERKSEYLPDFHAADPQNGKQAVVPPSDDQGLRSVVNNAFVRNDDQKSVPPTPVSKDSSSNMSRANTGSTTGISPIMSRVPSSATSAMKIRNQTAEGSTPAIAEEPAASDVASPAAVPTSAGESPPTNNNPQHPTAGHSRDISASSLPRSGFATPTRGDSPARSSVIATSPKDLPQPITAQITTENLDSPDAMEGGLAGPSPAYANREADLANEAKHSTTGVNSQLGAAETQSQKAFLDSHTAQSPVQDAIPRDRSESPSKGRVQALAGKFGDVSHSRRGSTQSNMSRNSVQSWENSRNNSRAASPTKASPSKPSSPVKEFRPHLPGQWESYATTVNTPSEQGDRGKELSSTSNRVSSPLDAVDLTATTAKQQVAGADASAVSHTHTTLAEDPIAALKDAGSAMVESIRTTVGLQDTASESQHEPKGKPAHGNMYVPRPLQLERTISSQSSIPPTPPEENTAELEVAHSPPVTEQSSGVLTGQQSPIIDTPLSTELSAGDEESDRLRKEIVASLSPVRATTDDTGESNRASLRPLSSPNNRASSILPSEYDMYWAEEDSNTPRLSQNLEQSDLVTPPVAAASTVTDSEEPAKPSLLNRFSWEANNPQLLQQGASLSAVMLEHTKSPQTESKSSPTGPTREHAAKQEHERQQSLGGISDSQPGPDHVITVTKPDPVTDPRPEEQPSTPPLDAKSLTSPTREHTRSPGLHVVNTREDPEAVDLPPRFSADQEQAPRFSPEDNVGLTPLPQSNVPPPVQETTNEIPTQETTKEMPKQETTNEMPKNSISREASVVSRTEKPLGAREIATISSTAERIATYNATREQWAAVDHGLQSWLTSTIEANPELSTASFPLQRVPTASTRHKHSGSLALLGKFGGTSHHEPSPEQSSSAGASVPAASSSPTPTRPSIPGFGGRVGSQNMQLKGEKLLHTANVLGGKGMTSAKGLFAKGKSRFGRDKQTSLSGRGSVPLSREASEDPEKRPSRSASSTVRMATLEVPVIRPRAEASYPDDETRSRRLSFSFESRLGILPSPAKSIFPNEDQSSVEVPPVPPIPNVVAQRHHRRMSQDSAHRMLQSVIRYSTPPAGSLGARPASRPTSRKSDTGAGAQEVFEAWKGPGVSETMLVMPGDVEHPALRRVRPNSAPHVPPQQVNNNIDVNRRSLSAILGPMPFTIAPAELIMLAQANEEKKQKKKNMHQISTTVSRDSAEYDRASRSDHDKMLTSAEPSADSLTRSVPRDDDQPRHGRDLVSISFERGQNWPIVSSPFPTPHPVHNRNAAMDHVWQTSNNSPTPLPHFTVDNIPGADDGSNAAPTSLSRRTVDIVGVGDVPAVLHRAGSDEVSVMKEEDDDDGGKCQRIHDTSERHMSFHAGMVKSGDVTPVASTERANAPVIAGEYEEGRGSQSSLSSLNRTAQNPESHRHRAYKTEVMGAGHVSNISTVSSAMMDEETTPKTEKIDPGTTVWFAKRTLQLPAHDEPHDKPVQELSKTTSSDMPASSKEAEAAKERRKPFGSQRWGVALGPGVRRDETLINADWAPHAHGSLDTTRPCPMPYAVHAVEEYSASNSTLATLDHDESNAALPVDSVWRDNMKDESDLVTPVAPNVVRIVENGPPAHKAEGACDNHVNATSDDYFLAHPGSSAPMQHNSNRLPIPNANNMTVPQRSRSILSQISAMVSDADNLSPTVSTGGRSTPSTIRRMQADSSAKPNGQSKQIIVDAAPSWTKSTASGQDPANDYDLYEDHNGIVKDLPMKSMQPSRGVGLPNSSAAEHHPVKPASTPRTAKASASRDRERPRYNTDRPMSFVSGPPDEAGKPQDQINRFGPFGPPSDTQGTQIAEQRQSHSDQVQIPSIGMACSSAENLYEHHSTTDSQPDPVGKPGAAVEQNPMAQRQFAGGRKQFNQHQQTLQHRTNERRRDDSTNRAPSQGTDQVVFLSKDERSSSPRLPSKLRGIAGKQQDLQPQPMTPHEWATSILRPQSVDPVRKHPLHAAGSSSSAAQEIGARKPVGSHTRSSQEYRNSSGSESPYRQYQGRTVQQYDSSNQTTASDPISNKKKKRFSAIGALFGRVGTAGDGLLAKSKEKKAQKAQRNSILALSQTSRAYDTTQPQVQQSKSQEPTLAYYPPGQLPPPSLPATQPTGPRTGSSHAKLPPVLQDAQNVPSRMEVPRHSRPQQGLQQHQQASGAKTESGSAYLRTKQLAEEHRAQRERELANSAFAKDTSTDIQASSPSVDQRPANPRQFSWGTPSFEYYRPNPDHGAHSAVSVMQQQADHRRQEENIQVQASHERSQAEQMLAQQRRQATNVQEDGYRDPQVDRHQMYQQQQHPMFKESYGMGQGEYQQHSQGRQQALSRQEAYEAAIAQSQQSQSHSQQPVSGYDSSRVAQVLNLQRQQQQQQQGQYASQVNGVRYMRDSRNVSVPLSVAYTDNAVTQRRVSSPIAEPQYDAPPIPAAYRYVSGAFVSPGEQLQQQEVSSSQHSARARLDSADNGIRSISPQISAQSGVPRTGRTPSDTSVVSTVSPISQSPDLSMKSPPLSQRNQHQRTSSGNGDASPRPTLAS
ncbi:predicted protein [Plenodomus lingam JN3]|uniref:Predicted protein n=1 Tax=Leptosphaeria maculans (strain JN3 / isolate v23.1.3 / race Av1-4-5-6-7-8) TaxID=985895 RepID=E4ZTH6_LEPMJ|nr:predicted protein [Plenodomus lingam JN3]CBX94832.1 predicted protein [Plenodomus lingam JN3]